MDTATTIWLIVGALLLFSFFVSYMSSKTWQVLHVLLVVVVMFAAGVFCMLGAATLKTHQAWRTIYNQLTAKVKTTEIDNDELLYGKLLEVRQTTDSKRSLMEDLQRIVLDRGRVWRECPVIQVNGDTVTLTVAQPVDGQPPPPHRIEDKAVLFAFKEVQLPEGWKVPEVYLGTFIVSNPTETTVSLSPMLPLDAQQRAQLQGGTWTLYEVMPVDSHHFFADMDGQALRQLIPNVNVPAGQYDAMVHEYEHDLKTADPATDPPSQIWLRVRFTKPHSVDVDVQGPAPRLSQTDFDPTGRALPAKLRQGEPTEFDVGDTGLFDPDTADNLIKQGLAEEVEKVYVRPLRDYASHFVEFQRQSILLDEEAAEIQADTQIVMATNAKAQEQIAFREQEKTQLGEDKSGFTAERDALKSLLASLDTSWQNLQRRLSEAYRANLLLNTQLTEMQRKMAEEINRKAAEAMAQNETAVPAVTP